MQSNEVDISVVLTAVRNSWQNDTPTFMRMQELLVPVPGPQSLYHGIVQDFQLILKNHGLNLARRTSNTKAMPLV